MAKFIGLVLGVQGVREVTAPSIEKGIEKPFLIRDRSGVERIAPSDIMYCRGAGRCTEIYVRADQEATRSRKRVSSKVLRQVLEELPQNGYIRAHKQTIVNISYVKKYVQRSPHARASARVLMFDGCWLEVSRRNTGLVLTAYEQ
ncbi:MAG: LytTR family transcriptional regulator [Flavobacteriales bacterium]|nr:LytTR family transcriptional regulator [Flavobacteriales bacterium]